MADWNERSDTARKLAELAGDTRLGLVYLCLSRYPDPLRLRLRRDGADVVLEMAAPNLPGVWRPLARLDSEKGATAAELAGELFSPDSDAG